MGVTRTEANRYIQLKQLALAGGGSDPGLESRVEALETAVDGEGGLTDQVDTLDEQINGDSTATPPVPGIVDEIEALEVSVYGDSTATPPVTGIVDEIEALNATVYGDSTTTPATLGIVDQLTASNDVPFRFGYDSTTQKYGYILDVGGADTVIPFSTGTAASDINPGKATTAPFIINLQNSAYTCIPVGGYKKVALHNSAVSGSLSVQFYFADGTSTTEETYIASTATAGWGSYLDIPDNAVTVLFKFTSSYARIDCYFSLTN